MFSKKKCLFETKTGGAWVQQPLLSPDGGCPRPLLVQTGKKDGIAHWPQVLEELDASKEHYRKLGLGDRIGIDLHDGGHEIRVDSGVAFMKKWLKA